MQRNVFAVVILVAGCTVGAPPGFSSGDRWVFPLVGPLENGLLLTPVSVHGHGPYLFAIDPDANVTAIDKGIVDEVGLRMGSGPHRIDESDTGQIRFYAELLEIRVANLTVDRRDGMVFPDGLYDTEGRHIRGILGRDVLADSLVFGFDRDQGIAMLSTTRAFQAPPGAISIAYQQVSSRATTGMVNEIDQSNAGRPSPVASLPDVVPVPRRLARAQIGGAQFAMHLDLGATTSQLPEVRWGQAGLTPADGKLKLVDEAATPRQVTHAGIAGDVTVGTAKAPHVSFVPFIEKRFATEGVDGALGLDFFRPYAVFAYWDKTTYYLKPRGDAAATLAARLGRWGAAFPACPHPACITAELSTSDAGTTLQVARDAQAANHPLEVFLGVSQAQGHGAAPLVVELPAGADQLVVAVPAEYAGASLTVLDASPFPRACIGDRGCLAVIGEPLAGNAELGPLTPGAVAAPAMPAAPAAPAVPPRNVALDKLRRVSGDAAIPASDDAQKAAGGKPLATAIIRFCLNAEGKVEVTKVVKSSGVTAYDDQLQSTIKSTWAFEPVETDGKPGPVCTSVTFAARTR
jgi:TonB family protein